MSKTNDDRWYHVDDDGTTPDDDDCGQFSSGVELPSMETLERVEAVLRDKRSHGEVTDAVASLPPPTADDFRELG